MAVQYHTHTFEIPVATKTETGEVLLSDKVVVPSSLGTMAVRDAGDFPAIGTEIIAGTGLTGGGSLAANVTLALSSTSLTSLGLADTAVQPARLINTGIGLAGGGDMSSDRTIALSSASQASLALADTAVQPTRQVLAGTGMQGGGALSSNVTLSLSASSQSSLALANTAVQPARTVSAGTGLTGGGDLSANRTIALSAASIASLANADSAVQPGNAALVPSGGATGEVLAKTSATDFDTEWVAIEAATAVSYGPQSLSPAQQQQAQENIGLGGEIDVSLYGGSPSNPDNTAAFNDAATAARAAGARLVCRVKGNYDLVTATPVNLRFLEVDFSGVSLTVKHAAIGVIMGGDASNPNNPPQRVFSVIRDGGATSTPTIRCIGAKGQYITLERCDYFQVWASTTAGVRSTDYSSAYSKFWLKYVNKIELQSDPANAGGPPDGGDGGTVQWINENCFYLDRAFTFIVDGTYNHNHNRIFGGTFEGAALIDFKVGNSNSMSGIRFEGGPTTINFGAGTWNNKIERTWTSSPQQQPEAPIVSGTITDLGVDNKVFSDFAILNQYETVAYTDIAEVVLNNEAGDITNRSPNLQKIHGTAGNVRVMQSRMLPVKNGERFFWGQFSLPGDTSLYRPFIEYFNANLVPIADATGVFEFVGLTPVTSGNMLISGTGTAQAWGHHSLTAESSARFCRVGWAISNGQQANALAKALWVRRAGIPDSGVNQIGGTIALGRRTKVVSAAPTQGFAPVGFEAIRTNGTTRHVCTFALDTSLSSGGGSGSTSLTLASATGVASGDIIGVNLNDRTTHWTTVSGAPSGTTVTLAAALPSAAANGSRVVFNRWV